MGNICRCSIIGLWSDESSAVVEIQLYARIFFVMKMSRISSGGLDCLNSVCGRRVLRSLGFRSGTLRRVCFHSGCLQCSATQSHEICLALKSPAAIVVVASLGENIALMILRSSREVGLLQTEVILCGPPGSWIFIAMASTVRNVARGVLQLERSLVLLLHNLCSGPCNFLCIVSPVSWGASHLRRRCCCLCHNGIGLVHVCVSGYRRHPSSVYLIVCLVGRLFGILGTSETL